MARPSFRTSALTARLLCSAAVLFLPGMAHANPAGAQVVAGSATVAQPSHTATTITQQSEKAIIDWRSFSISQGETTAFRQPDSKAITLNRVTGGDPSAILGNLTANGQVWLINPNGIAFGKSARVDVAGLLATTIDIANNDFMSGNYRFQSARDPNTMVTNAGQITIHDAGLAALVAPGVANSGVIEADLGQVQLSSASAFTVDLYGDGLFNIALDKKVTQAIRKGDGSAVTTAVENSGKLIADGGRVLLTANAAKSVVDHAIDMSGYIQATSASVAENGDIVLDGGSEGTVAVAGTLDASGRGQGQRGGTAEITGQNVQLSSIANVNVSGNTGGGTAHIGGDEHGRGPLSNASTTSIAAGAAIRADAVTDGNGGSVVVWSDDKTDFQGSISAKGGARTGNGGSAEVSSHRLLDFTGTADLRAGFGTTGSLLLDPENVTIQASGTDTVTPDPSGTSYTGNVDNSIITTVTLQNALTFANVTVSTGSSGNQSGDIFVDAEVNWNVTTLTLSAYRNIVIDGALNPTGLVDNHFAGIGNLILRADNTGTGIGTVIFEGSGHIDDRVTCYGGCGSAYISIYYNPDGGYTHPTDFSPYIQLTSTIPVTSYMLVNSASDLQNIQNNLSSNYALGRDIDASSTATWNSGLGFEPIDGFSGLLDGEGHSIQSLSINRQDDMYLGLFGRMTGTIENLSLENVSVVRSGDLAFNYYTSSLVAYNEGTVDNVSVSGSVDGGPYSLVGGLIGENDQGFVINSSSSVEVSGKIAGGLVGSNIGQILSSHATGDVICSSECGGLVGIDNGVAFNSNPGSIVRSYATGDVTAKDGSGIWAGGLVGYANGDTISASYSSGDVIGSIAGGLIGLADSTGSTGVSIVDSYAIGNANAGPSGAAGGLVAQVQAPLTLFSTYSAGRVVGQYAGGLVGGLAGARASISATYSYWDTLTSGQTTSAGGTGLNTAQLKSSLPWGFDPAFWSVNPSINSGYPYLSLNPPAGSPSQPPATPDSITWSVADVAFTYGTLATLGAATLNGVGVADQDDVFGTVGLFANASLTDPVSLSAGLHAGTYYEAVTGLTGSAASNYTLSDTGNVLGQLTVDPKMLTWVVADANSTYGTQAILGSATLTGVLSGDTGNVQPVGGISKNGTPVTLTTTTSAGTYDETVIDLSGAAADNYALAPSGNEAGTLTINPKALMWSVANATAKYGATPVPGAITLYGVVIPDDVRAEVGVFNGAVLEPLSNTIPLGSYSEMVTDLVGNAANNYVLATTGNITGTLTVSLSAGNAADVSHLQSLTSNPTSSVNGNPTPIGSIPPSSSFRPMAIDILNSAGVDYLTNSALTDMLTNLLMQLPWQYLAQSSIEEKFVEKLQADTDLRQSIGGGDVTNEAAGLLAGVLIGVVHDYLAESGMSPVIVEEGTLLATAGVNYSLAERQFHDPRLAGAYAVTETTLGEIIETTETFYSWEGETDQRIIQSKQMEAYAEQLHAEAESIKGQPGMDEQYQSLMKASVSESQAAAFLAKNASGYGNGNILSAFWNSLW